MRFTAWIILTGLLLFQAGPPAESASWDRLELTLNQLGAHSITYCGYCFLPERGPLLSSLRQLANQSRPPQWRARLLVKDKENSLSEAGESLVLQVVGYDYRACRNILLQAEQLVATKPNGSTMAWMTEALLEGDCSDMSQLMEKMLKDLSGTLRSVYRDEFTINILAYTPVFKSNLIVEGVPINLNLELRYNPNLGLIRIRTGLPLLVSNIEV